VDKIDLPLFEQFGQIDLRPWYWFALLLVVIVLFVNFRLRDSRPRPAWIALREDEVAGGVDGRAAREGRSCSAYGTGACVRRHGGRVPGLVNQTRCNADQFAFSFSIFVPRRW
jgi:branched-chain amino acid transport system permease protein